MREFSITALAQIIEACVEKNRSHKPGATTCCFTRVSTDSRTTKAGDCFFAIRGENFDGHDYVTDALAKGAVCAVVSRDVSSCMVRGAYREKEKVDSCFRRNDNRQYAIGDTQYCVLKVSDTVKALGAFAGQYRRQAGFKVVAITGSVGKTMTRQIAYHVLSRHFRVSQSPRNFNNYIGLPLTLLGADPQDQIVIAELGTNHPGEIAYLARIALPDIAVVTNVQPAHLEGFGSLEAIREEKLSISEGLRPNGVLIINTDTVSRPANAGYRVVTFGKSVDCDYQARNITFDGARSSFFINGTPICLPVPGQGNVENALAAWAICSHFGLTAAHFAGAIETLTAVAMRTEVLQIGPLTVINDCYNANPASMRNALDILTSIDAAKNRRLVFVCGDMAELGQHSEALHAELGASIAQARVQLLLVVGEFAGITAEAAKKAADYDLQTECFKDTFEVCNNLHKFVKNNDIILVKGSRTAKLEAVTEKLQEVFS